MPFNWKQEVIMDCCDLASSCDFFNSSAEMPHRVEFLKGKYCRGDFCECARYIIHYAYGKEKVPRNLSPDDLCMNHRRYINGAQKSNLPSGLVPQMANSCRL